MADKPDYAGGRKAREMLRGTHEKEMADLHEGHMAKRREMSTRHEGEIKALYEKHFGGGKKDRAPIYKGQK